MLGPNNNKITIISLILWLRKERKEKPKKKKIEKEQESENRKEEVDWNNEEIKYKVENY